MDLANIRRVSKQYKLDSDLGEDLLRQYYWSIPPHFEHINTLKIKLKNSFIPQGIGTGYNEVPVLERIQRFLNTLDDRVALFVIDYARPKEKYLHWDEDSIPWQVWNRQIIFYSETDEEFRIGSNKMFTHWSGGSFNSRHLVFMSHEDEHIERYIPFNHQGGPFKMVYERHLSEAKNILDSEDVVSGLPLLDRTQKSWNLVVNARKSLRST